MVEIHYSSDMVDLAFVLRNAIEDELEQEVELVHDSAMVEGTEILIVTNGLIDEVLL